MMLVKTIIKIIAIGYITLVSFCAVASECSVSSFTAPLEDRLRLSAGLAGKWNDSFTENRYQIEDIDGNPWKYFALEKRPENPKKLILFLHGFLEFSWAWEKQLEYFGDDYHAVAIDLKGHHYSSRPDDVDEYHFLELAWEIRALIHCLGYEKAIIVGHDFGGGIGWTLGMLHPDIVEKLVILSVPHPYLFARAQLNPDSDQLHRTKYIEYAQSYSMADQLKFSQFILSDFSIFRSGFYGNGRLGRLSGEVWLPTSGWRYMKHYYRAMPYPATEQDFPAELSDFQRKIYTVRRPTLVIVGAEDPYFSPLAYEGLEELVPDLEQVVYEKGTHWVHHEADDLNLRIENFINK